MSRGRGIQMDELKALIEKYKWRIIAVLVGVVLTILLLTIGFWRTLLLLVIVAVCYFIGMLLDHGGKESLDGILQALFKK